MGEFNQERFDQILREGYPLNTNQCIMDGLQLYRAYFPGFAVFALLMPMVNILLDALLAPGIGLLATSLLLAPLLNAGYFLVANKLIGRQPVAFADFFGARSHAVRLILSNLIYTIILLAVLSPTYFVFERSGFIDWYQVMLQNPTNPDPPDPPVFSPQESTVLFLNLIPLVYLVVGYVWAYPLILFFNLGPWQALEYSRRLVTRRWGGVFIILTTFFSLFLMGSIALTLMRGLGEWAAQLGVMALFLLVPWTYGALHVAFAYAVGGLMPNRQDPRA